MILLHGFNEYSLYFILWQKNAKSAGANLTKSRIYPKTRKGHLTRAKENGENLEENEEKSDEDEQMVDLDLESHGPNWLVGRSDRTRKTKKTLPKNVNTDSAELTKMREEIAVEMEEKMKKLSKIFVKLDEMNPDLNINVEYLYAESSVEVDVGEDGDGDNGSDEEDGSNEVNGDEDAANEDEDDDA